MARFFQAPVLQPVDYGYDMPFNEIYTVLQQKQKEQDVNIAALEELRDKRIKSLEQDYTVRNTTLQDRYKRIDEIMYDPEGNLQDLTGMSHLIRKEARKQAKEEMTGGKVWALETSHDRYYDYIAEIKKQHEKGDISKDRYDYLKNASYNRYSGIGDKAEYATTDLFSGISAAKEYDEFQIAADYLKGWKSDQIQTAYSPGEPGTIRFTEDYLKHLQDKYPEMGYIGPTKGTSRDYVQTGTLEYVLFNEVYEAAVTKLVNDQNVTQDLRQEAQQYGAKSEEQIQAYMMQKISDAAEQAAAKESHFKFDPKIRENWRMREAVKAKHNRALEQWKLDQERSDFYVASTGSTIKTVSSGNIKEEIETLTSAIQGTKEKLAKYQTADGIKDGEQFLGPNAAIKEAEYNKLLNDLSAQQAELNSKKQVLSDLFTRGGIDKLPKMFKERYDEHLKYHAKSAGIEEGSREWIQAAQLYENAVAPILNSMTAEQAADAMAAGEIPGLKEAITPVMDYIRANANDRYKAYHKREGTNARAARIGQLTLESLYPNIDGVEIEYERDYQVLTPGVQSNKDPLFRLQRDLKQRIETGAIQLRDNINYKPIKSIHEALRALTGGEYDRKKGILDVRTTANFDKNGYGAPTIVVSYLDSKGDEQSMGFAIDQSSISSFNKDYADVWIDKIQGAIQMKADPNMRQNYTDATNMLGKTVYAAQFSRKNIAHMPPNEERVIETPRGDKMIIKKTDQGRYVVYKARKDKETGRYKKITDKRGVGLYDHGLLAPKDADGNPTDFIYNTEDDLYRWFGELEYDNQLNRYNPRY